jgi:hypothetical protein
VANRVAAQPEGEARADVFYSRDEAQRQGDAPTPPRPRTDSTSGTSPAEADRIASDQEDAFAEKPHVYALGAFAGAFVFAQILKRLTGGDD